MSLTISGAAVTRLPKAGGFHSLRFYSERHLIKVFKVLAHARRKQQNQGPLMVGCVLQQARLQHKREAVRPVTAVTVKALRETGALKRPNNPTSQAQNFTV